MHSLCRALLFCRSFALSLSLSLSRHRALFCRSRLCCGSWTRPPALWAKPWRSSRWTRACLSGPVRSSSFATLSLFLAPSFAHASSLSSLPASSLELTRGSFPVALPPGPRAGGAATKARLQAAPKTSRVRSAALSIAVSCRFEKSGGKHAGGGGGSDDGRCVCAASTCFLLIF